MSSASTPRTSLDKDKIRILLLEGISETAVENFARAGYRNVESVPGSLPREALLERIEGVHMLGIRSRTQLDDEIFEAARRLMAVGCFCIGTNQVDLTAAVRRGIPVFNAPFSNTRSVAELVLAEAILLLRGVPQKSALAHRGVWQKTAKHSYELRGKTLGIIGYGNIGAQLGVLAEAFGMRVRFYDVVRKLKLGNAEQVDSLRELLSMADVVTLHVPDTPSTRNMIDESMLGYMKREAVLINASRGTVVDIDALAKAIAADQLLGAAIDVFPKEPRTNEDPFESPLRRFDNVILTPHIGGSTVEAQESIGGEVSEKLVLYSDNGSTIGSVNFPEVGLPSHPGKHRLLHIHRNVPGVLSAINRVFSDSGLNISAQYLQTNTEIGYVVVDTDADHSELALEGIRRVEGTIRTRVLF
ncbi:MAG: phosphoglycerate dehydrogenase [Pseudomonadales bacterium]|jgi:D-3-phosphoglycerate dehydrogenase|nr:phosphoglycerate dehydrogenase [Pseudomonadales bacterium]